MARLWIDVHLPSTDAKAGDGPIITATEWSFNPTLDEAGSFSFSMPATDSRVGLLQNKRVVRAYMEDGGSIVEVGAGIIDKVAYDATDPSMLRVSGPDLLAELAGRNIAKLIVCGQALTYLTLNAGTGHWTGSVRRIANLYGALHDHDLPEAHDGETGFGGETVRFWNQDDPNIEYVYVGCDARFDYIIVTLAAYPDVNERESALRAQYFNGSGWVDLPGLWDGTGGWNYASQWCTMAQSGEIHFTRPDDWTRVQPTVQAGSWFWVRLTAQIGEETDNFILREAAVWADVPTTEGVNQIMAHAPATWTTSGYPHTASAKYLELSGESVLAALRALVEQGGQSGGVPVREHFRLGTGRSLAWLSAFTASGLRAVSANGILAEGANELCLIRRLKVTQDTAETVTRLYPQSNDGITLHLTTRTAPAGYSLNKTDGYLQNDTGATAYGRIEAAPRYSDIASQQPDSWYEHPSMVANAVFDRALEYLRTHGTAQGFYDLDVAKVRISLLPGHTIRVVYHEYRDGVHSVDIDRDLYVLSTRVQVDRNGLHTVGLQVATVDRPPQSDVGVLRGAIQDVRRGVGTGAETRILLGPGGGGGGGASFPGTISFTTINTDSGSEHFHALDIASHTTDQAAHHAPVTAGSGIGVIGQQVSLTTPGTLAHDSVNAAAGSHTHAVTASANPGAAASLLKTDTNGYLRLERLGLGQAAATHRLEINGSLLAAGVAEIWQWASGAPANARAWQWLPSAVDGSLNLIAWNDAISAGAYALTITRSGHTITGVTLPSAKLNIEYNAGNYLSITVASDGAALLGTTTSGAGGNLTLQPAGDIITYPGGKDVLPGVGYETNIGSLQKKYLTLHAAELWVETLVAHETIATIGGRILVGPTTELVEDLADSTPDNHYIIVKHNELANGDRVYMEANGKVEFFAITSGATGTGPYSYTVTRNLDGSGKNSWYAGDAVFNTGTTGDGFIDLYSVRGVKAATEYGPSIVGNVRNSSTYNDWSAHWALGNLNGVYGYGSTTYGFAAGKYANGASFVTVDATNGIRMLSRTGGVDTIRAQWAVDGVLTIGEVASGKANVLISAGALGIRLNATERIGLTAAGILTIKDSGGAAVITLDASAGAEITKKLTMPGANSAIAIGATPPTSASAGTGIWLDRTGLYGLLSSVVQAKMDATTGAIVAAAGKTVLNVDGVTLDADTVAGTGAPYSAPGTAVKWMRAGTSTKVGSIYGNWNVTLGVGALVLEGQYDASNRAAIALYGTPAGAFITLTGKVSIDGSLSELNVGTATSAATGQIRASGNLSLNSASHIIEQNNLTSLADDATANLLQSAGRHGLYFVVCSTDVQAVLFIYASAVLTIISDPTDTFRATDADGYHCILLDGTTLTLKNRRGAAKNYRITRIE